MEPWRFTTKAPTSYPDTHYNSVLEIGQQRFELGKPLHRRPQLAQSGGRLAVLVAFERQDALMKLAVLFLKLEPGALRLDENLLVAPSSELTHFLAGRGEPLPIVLLLGGEAFGDGNRIRVLRAALAMNI